MLNDASTVMFVSFGRRVVEPSWGPLLGLLRAGLTGSTEIVNVQLLPA